MQSCLSLKYEALLLRDAKSTGEQSLQISYLEWLNIHRDWLGNGFYSIPVQACEKSLPCFEKNGIADTITGEVFEDAQIIEEIKRFKDRAVKSAASGSVIMDQAQAADYLKRKIVEKSKLRSSFH